MMHVLVAVVAIWLAQAPPATGSIRGLVIDRETGRPLPRAVVRVYPTGAWGESVSTATDERGRFTFDGLSPGRYDGDAVAARHGGAPLTTGRASLVVSPGRPVDVTVALPCAYAISLRVLDS